MAKPRETNVERLAEIKKTVKQSHEYFRKNYHRYHEFQKFVFATSLNSAEVNMLQELQKPQVEFNILEAHISRIEGEFMEMAPGYKVTPADGVVLSNPLMIDVVQGHLRASFSAPDKDSLSQKLFRSLLTGGFAVGKIWTDYKNNMSMDQDIFVDTAFDPTLCGFDPLARKSHKGDGRYCYELFPTPAEELKRIYGSDVMKQLRFVRGMEGFNWTYQSETEDVALLCEYYYKKIKEGKILKLSSQHVVTEQQYEQLLQQWEEQGRIEQPPIVLKSRKAPIEVYERYTVCDTQILDYVKTDYDMFPLIFFDGNSAMIRDSDQSPAYQMTRPFVYQAKDVQRLRNYAGQTLGAEIENLVMHKWKSAIESIPDNEDYKIAYENPQQASVILYNAFKDGDPNQPLPPPQEIARVPIPPEIAATFAMTENMVQLALGSYDTAQGNTRGDLSGIAIRRGTMNSNQAAKPYFRGFIDGWNRMAQCYVSLMPKYMKTPRTIPVMSPTGKRGYMMINKPGQVYFNYDIQTLQVQVESGVNFEVQKEIALETILKLMQASESFGAFMNAEGLEVLLDNLDIKGVETLKVMARQWMEQQKKSQAEQAQKAAQTPTPEELQAKALDIEEFKAKTTDENTKMDLQIKAQKIASDDSAKKEENDIEATKVMASIGQQRTEQQVKMQETDAENARTAVDMAISLSKNVRETEAHSQQMSESKKTEQD